MRVHEKNRRKCPPLDKASRYALYFTMVVAVWAAGKQLEPVVFPVVKNFHITEVISEGDNLWIAGEFNKVRGCEFVDVVGYSGKQHVTVVFDEHPEAPVVTRIRGYQTFGPWLLVPKVSRLSLYAHHRCTTGLVTTKLFDGVVAK